MTALDRARGWFVAPEPRDDGPPWSAPPPAARDEGVPRSSRPAEADNHTPRGGGWQPPIADESPVDAEDAASRARPIPTTRSASRAETPAPVRPAAPAGAATLTAAPTSASPRVVTSAAVLGRAGEVEAVAAALALALRRESRAAAATVAVIGAGLPDVAGGGGAARRLGARLEGHGFEVCVRGRVAWVRLDPGDEQLAVAARRVTLVGAPAVLAVTAPRSAATDEALVECDQLVIVAAEPEGPLARLAASGLAGVPVVTVRPLGRGLARALASAGIRSTRPVRDLLSTEQEQQ